MATPAEIGLRAVLDMANMDSNSKRFLAEVDQLKKEVSSFASSSSSSLRNSGKEMGIFGEAVHRVSSIVNGIIVADIFRGIAREIRGVVSEVFQATSEFQSLQIQFETLAARDYMAEFGGSIDEALEATSGTAQDLLMWVRQIAVTTPFTVENLGNTLAMGKAYGFTTEEAQKLVLTVGDFTAGMGLSGEVMERIIYNMGQMMAAGKPTGRELRDLSNSFVPVIEIADRMAEKLGVTRNEMLEMFRTGKVSAREFVDEFTLLVGEQFPGAMERMSRTFQGVTSNIQDFIQTILGFELLGPIASDIASDLNDALKGLLTPEVFSVAEAGGESLSFAYGKIAEAVKAGISSISDFRKALGINAPTVTGFAESILRIAANAVNMAEGVYAGFDSLSAAISDVLGFFNTSFEQLGADMQLWGQNVIYQFAAGIVQGIVFVIQAITAVANTITKMLQANSPPLILPELEEWGASAMLSYMNGWRNADFSAFEDIGALLERAIMSWRGTTDEQDLVSRVIGSTISMSSAVEEFKNFGRVSESTLSKIADAAGFASDEFKDFINLSLSFEGFQGISDAVESALDFEGVGSVNVFGQVVDSFQDLISMADLFGRDLSATVSSYASDSMRLIEINDLVKRSQEEINTVTKQYDEVLASLNAELQLLINRQEDTTRIYDIDKALTSKILTSRERERLELEKKRILLEREIKTTQAEKNTTLSTLKSKLEGYQQEQDAIEARVNREKDLLKSLSEAQLQSAKDQLEAVRSVIQAQIELNELYGRTIEVGVKAKKGGAGSAEELAEEIESAISGAIGSGINTEDIELAFDELWETIKAEVDKAWEEFGKIFDPIEEPFNELVGALEQLFGSGELQKSIDGFVADVQTALKPLSDWWETDGEKLATAFGEIFGTILGNIIADNPNTGKSMLDVIAESLGYIVDSIVENGPELTDLLGDVKDFLNDDAFPKIQEILLKISKDVIPKIIDFVVQAGPTVLDILGFIVRNVDKIVLFLTALRFLSIFAVILPVVLALQGPLAGVVTALTGLGAPALFAVGLMALLGGGIIAVQDAYDAGKFDGILKFFNELGPNIKEGVSKASEAVTEWITTISESINTWIQETFGEGGTLETSFSEFGATVTEKLGEIGTSLAEWYNSVFGEQGTITLAKDAFFDAIMKTYEDFGIWISEKATEISETLGTWIVDTFGEEGTVTTGIKNFWESTKLGFSLWALDVLGKFLELKDSVVAWLTETFGPEGTLITGFSEFITTTVEDFSTWISDVFEKFNELMKSLGDWVVDVFGPEGSLIEGIKAFGTEFEAWWDKVFGPEGLLVSWFSDFFENVVPGIVEDFVSLGQDLVKGVIHGITKMWEWGVDQVSTFFNDLIEAARGAVRAESPSKEFADLGVDIVQGLVLGIQSLSHVPQDLITGMLKRSISASVALSSPSNFGSSTVYNDNRVSVNMQASYAGSPSPVTVYHDLTAALASARL